MALDFETNNQYQLSVRATDSGQPALHVDVEITVGVTDVNEAPADLVLSWNVVSCG